MLYFVVFVVLEVLVWVRVGLLDACSCGAQGTLFFARLSLVYFFACVRRKKGDLT